MIKLAPQLSKKPGAVQSHKSSRLGSWSGVRILTALLRRCWARQHPDVGALCLAANLAQVVDKQFEWRLSRAQRS
jgi:hypothetical protein